MAAKNLLTMDTEIDPHLKNAVGQLANAGRSKDCYEQLAAIQALHYVKFDGPMHSASPVAIMRQLIEVVWHYAFMDYFRLRRIGSVRPRSGRITRRSENGLDSDAGRDHAPAKRRYRKLTDASPISDVHGQDDCENPPKYPPQKPVHKNIQPKFPDFQPLT